MKPDMTMVFACLAGFWLPQVLQQNWVFVPLGIAFALGVGFVSACADKRRPQRRRKPDVRTLTPEQARLILDAHNIEDTLDSEEESDLLEQHNPALLHAYLDLQGIADGSD